MKKITAVIAARKNSCRIPAKMRQIIDGESMIMRKVRQCMATDGLYSVVVCTDDETIQNQVEKAGARFYRQPDEFCQGNNPNGMIKDALTSFESDLVLWAHPTNPFINEEHYKDAINALESMEKSGYDSLFSVNKLSGHFWNQNPSPINFSPTAPIHKIGNHLPSIYAQNGGIFIRPHKDMAKDGLFVAGKAHMFTMDQITGWDIDYQWELEFAQHYATIKGRIFA